MVFFPEVSAEVWQVISMRVTGDLPIYVPHAHPPPYHEQYTLAMMHYLPACMETCTSIRLLVLLLSSLHFSLSWVVHHALETDMRCSGTATPRLDCVSGRSQEVMSMHKLKGSDEPVPVFRDESALRQSQTCNRLYGQSFAWVSANVLGLSGILYQQATATAW